MTRIVLFIAGLMISFAGAASAGETLLGVWQTERDAKNQTGYVRIYPCGNRLCGTLIASVDKHGKPSGSPNVGRRIIWNVRSVEGWGKGNMYVPVMRNEYPTVLIATGNRLEVKVCNTVGDCDTQTWKRTLTN